MKGEDENHLFLEDGLELTDLLVCQPHFSTVSHHAIDELSCVVGLRCPLHEVDRVGNGAETSNARRPRKEIADVIGAL